MRRFERYFRGVIIILTLSITLALVVSGCDKNSFSKCKRKKKVEVFTSVEKYPGLNSLRRN